MDFFFSGRCSNGNFLWSFPRNGWYQWSLLFCMSNDQKLTGFIKWKARIRIVGTKCANCRFNAAWNSHLELVVNKTWNYERHEMSRVFAFWSDWFSMLFLYVFMYWLCSTRKSKPKWLSIMSTTKIYHAWWRFSLNKPFSKKKVCMTNQFSIFQSLVCFNISLVITQASGLDIAQQNGRPVLGFKFCQ